MEPEVVGVDLPDNMTPIWDEPNWINCSFSSTLPVFELNPSRGEATSMAKKKHGGKRPGAGRPVSPEGASIHVGVTVPSELMEKLDALAVKREWSRSKAVTEAIRLLLSAR